jgi:uncharacterized protein YigA (DUF484 family)
VVIHEWIEQHKDFLVNTVRWQRGCDELADTLKDVLNNCCLVLYEMPKLRRRIAELEKELATLKPAPLPVEREEYGMHIKYTGD